MRVLICGGRDYGNEKPERTLIVEAFCRLIEKHGNDITIINGGCHTGADKVARSLALAMELDCETYPARWKREGNAAGPLRNRRMIDQAHPQAGVAFPGGAGTADMVRRLRAAGVPVWIPYGGVDA